MKKELIKLREDSVRKLFIDTIVKNDPDLEEIFLKDSEPDVAIPLSLRQKLASLIQDLRFKVGCWIADTDLESYSSEDNWDADDAV